MFHDFETMFIVNKSLLHLYSARVPPPRPSPNLHLPSTLKGLKLNNYFASFIKADIVGRMFNWDSGETSCC